MKESKYGRRGSAVPVHDLRIQQLEAEVERLKAEIERLERDVDIQKTRKEEARAEVERLRQPKPNCGWVVPDCANYAETGCGEEVYLFKGDMSWVDYCPYCGCPVIQEGEE